MMKTSLTRTAVLRAFFAASALVLLPCAASAQSEMTPKQKELYEAAKKESGPITWYTAILNQQLDESVGDAFSAKYPGLKVNPIKTTAQVAFQRLLQDLKAGQAQADVFTTTDIGHMGYLKKQGQLVKYTPEGSKDLVKAIRDVDPEGYFHTGWVGLAAILYNKSKLKEADVPTDWPGLTDPKWKDQITFGSPNFSGMVGVWTVAMADRYGWDFFKKLNALNPQIGRSIDDAVTVLNSGERSIGMGNPGTAARSAAKGNPLGIVFPSSGTLMVISPSAILKDSKHPNTAKLFVDFLTSKEFSEILAKNYEWPLRADVKPPEGGKSLADMELFAPTPDKIAKELPGNKEKWRDTFGM